MRRLAWLDDPDWRAAIRFGAAVALLHRVLLTLWTSVLWLMVGKLPPWNGNPTFQEAAILPPLNNGFEQLVFGLWRRWDALHYLDLAWSGYRLSNPGPSVFGLLPPFGMRALALVLNNLDLGAAVFETACFALALIFLYRFVQVYFPEPNRSELPRWSVVTLALVPGSFFFIPPLSESPYLAATIGLFYFSTQRRWWLAALCGILATLARTQGVLLLGCAGLIFLEQVYLDQPQPIQWRLFLRRAVERFFREAWPVLLIPLGIVIFTFYRNSVGLPPLDEIYAQYSYIYFASPLEGLRVVVQWAVSHPTQLIANWDYWIYGIALVLACLTLLTPTQRRLPLVAYNFGFLLVFLSKINWVYGTHETDTIQSLSRYCLTLFPLAIFLASGLRQMQGLKRLLVLLLMGLVLALYSGMFVLGLTNP